MTEISNFFDGAAASASDFADMIRAILTSGVANGILNGLAPTQGPGLGVTVDSGFAIVNGEPYKNTASRALGLASNSGGGASRTDVVVVRANTSGSTWGNTPNNIVRLDVHQGTPGAGVPTLLTTSTQYEIALAWATISTSDTITSFVDVRAFAGPGLHDLVAAHSASGLTTGNVLQATGATSFGFGPLSAAAFGSQTANRVLAAPNGSAGNPTFRALVDADLPSRPVNSGILFSRTATGQAIQHGLTTVTVTNGTQTGSASLTFPVAFTAAPRVFTTINGVTGIINPTAEGPLTAPVESVTASGCTILIILHANAQATRNISVQWLAIGVPAA